MLDIPQIDGFAGQHPQRPVVVALGHGTAGNGDEMGLLRSGQRGSAPQLFPILQHRVQTAPQIPCV